MTPFVHLTPLDPRYPLRLRSLRRPPASLTLRGGSTEATRAVAIVGSRSAHPDARRFARELASTLARASAVVVSGGAFGIDEAAHLGALDAGGRTWAVAATGCHRCFPPEHAELFETIARGPGVMIWPFSPSSPTRPGSFTARNRVLVALSDAVVVVQAGLPSGALRAAECARAQRRPLWVVPAPPWAKGFEGSRLLLEQGAHPLTRVDALLSSLKLQENFADVRCRSTDPNAGGPASSGWVAEDPSQIMVLEAISNKPLHLDEIAIRTHMAVHTAAVALLTLALEAVVVEGPPGFFRRRDHANP